jgi:hypothetical protein
MRYIVGSMLAFGLLVMLVDCSAAQVKQDEMGLDIVACDVCLVRCAGCQASVPVSEAVACSVCMVKCGVTQTSRDAGSQ